MNRTTSHTGMIYTDKKDIHTQTMDAKIEEWPPLEMKFAKANIPL